MITLDQFDAYAVDLTKYERELERNSQAKEWERAFGEFVRRQDAMAEQERAMRAQLKRWADILDHGAACAAAPTPPQAPAPPPAPNPSAIVASPKDMALTDAINAVHAGRRQRPHEWPEW